MHVYLYVPTAAIYNIQVGNHSLFRDLYRQFLSLFLLSSLFCGDLGCKTTLTTKLKLLFWGYNFYFFWVIRAEVMMNIGATISAISDNAHGNE